MLSLVAAGVGVALVPQSMSHLHPGGVRYAPIMGDVQAVASLWVVRRKTDASSAAIENFMRIAGWPSLGRNAV